MDQNNFLLTLNQIISSEQKNEWFTFREIKKFTLKYKRVDFNNNTLIIYKFKTKDFDYDFYNFIARILLSYSFGFQMEYNSIVNNDNSNIKYIVSKSEFQDIIKDRIHNPTYILNYYMNPKKTPTNNTFESLFIGKNLIFIQNNGCFLLYIIS